MFNPPTKYVSKVMDSKKFAQYDLSLPKKIKSVSFDELPLSKKDGVDIHKLPRKSTLVQAVTAQQTLNAKDFMSVSQENDDDENETGTYTFCS